MQWRPEAYGGLHAERRECGHSAIGAVLGGGSLVTVKHRGSAGGASSRCHVDVRRRADDGRVENKKLWSARRRGCRRAPQLSWMFGWPQKRHTQLKLSHLQPTHYAPVRFNATEVQNPAAHVSSLDASSIQAIPPAPHTDLKETSIRHQCI